RRRQDQRLGGRLPGELARRVAEVEAGDALEAALARELRRPLALRERARLLDLGAAEHPPIARRERLRERRGGAEDVDHDPHGRRGGLARGESDVDAQDAITLVKPCPAACPPATAIPTARRALPARSAGARSARSA